MAKVAALTLTNFCLDVQINICMFLHLSDILALRKVRRVVWMAALRRVCLDNALFLPSFPLSHMSDLELEKSAMAPPRWVELCGAFKQPEDLNQHGGILRPRATRIIDGSFGTEVDYGAINFFLVPGGRYLLSYSCDVISVLDLGYTSSADCKLVASVRTEGGCNIRFAELKPPQMVWA